VTEEGQSNLNIPDLIKCKHYDLAFDKKYIIILANPATGILYVTKNSPDFISGQVRMRGTKGGKYPYKYLKMIDNIFGEEENTIEVCSGCSGSVKGNCFTVDINSDTEPDLVADGQKLDSIPNSKFSRWRCDPPYNARTAKEMYGTDLPRTIELLKAGARVCRLSKFGYQSYSNNIEIAEPPISGYIAKIKVYANYHFGDYLELVFICLLDYRFAQSLKKTGSDITLRRNMMQKLQMEIEGWIPTPMHGFFFNNEIEIFYKPFKLPSLYIYNTNDFVTRLDREPTGITILSNTIRAYANSFVSAFAENLEEFDSDPNLLNAIGIFPSNLLAVIDKALIVSYDSKFFSHSHGLTPCNFVALNFLARGSLDSNEIVIDFIFTLAYMIHLDFIIEKISIDSEKIRIPIFDGDNNPIHLSQMKHDAFQLNARLTHLDDFFQDYCRIETIYRLRNVAHIFLEEETWIGGISVNHHEYSISDYFKVRITKNIDEVSKMISHKKEAVAEHLHTLSSELQLNKEKPVVNTALIDIEEELITQIQKWKGKVDQREIEEWLLNFDSNEDMFLALKLLNKLSYITYDNLKSLSKALFNRIKAELGVMATKLCIFSYIGDITSGSAHTMKIFQEQNDLRKDLFVESTQLTSVHGKKVLLLLDDFIGSGNFFVKWFEENSSILSKFEKLYYCSLVAFEDGIKKVEKDSNVKVICGRKYEPSSKVLEGDLFSDAEKDQIKNLVTKYSRRLPQEYLWGRDNCQLLVALESHIPNNSLAILWASKYWSPLIERKG
jgi:hypothetical protein